MATKISLVITTRNEQHSLPCLFSSILTQSKLPNELVIVDANSTDTTPELIHNFAQNAPFPVKLISKKLNRSKGRNLGVQNATHSLIAITDAGCLLDKHWLERITDPLIADKAEVVAGYYLPITPTIFEKSVAPFVAVMPDKFDYSNFLPSSRSIAFTKEIFTKAGGYPTHLHYCEDLVFAQTLKNSSRLIVEPKAVVYWMLTSTYKQFFNQLKNYAYGDVTAGYAPHIKKIATVFLRYIPMFIFPPLLLIYLGLAVNRRYHYVKHPLGIIYLSALQLVADFAVMTGAIKGFVKSSTQH